MKTHFVIALLTATGAAADASAQYTATYGISFNGLGPNVEVVPGAMVNAVVWVKHDPGFTGYIHGLADGGFGISGSGPTDMGGWSGHTIPAPYNFLYGIATTGGVSSGYDISGVIWGTGAPWWAPPPPGLQTNPDNVWQGTFTVSPTAAYGSVLTVAFRNLETTNVWAGYPPFPSGFAFQSMPGPGGSITVIPAPAGLALLGLGGLTACRRPRRLQEAWT